MSDEESSRWERARRWGPMVVAAAFGTSGVIHMVRPSVFTPMIPDSLPAPTGLVYASGVAELVCAVGLVRRERWAGPASAAVLVAVFPGNVQMAVDVWQDAEATAAMKAGVLLRLPLQVPLIWAALQSGRHHAAGS